MQAFWGINKNPLQILAATKTVAPDRTEAETTKWGTCPSIT